MNRILDLNEVFDPVRWEKYKRARERQIAQEIDAEALEDLQKRAVFSQYQNNGGDV